MESYKELIREGIVGVEGSERIEKVKCIIAQTITERSSRLDKLSDERINHLLKEVE